MIFSLLQIATVPATESSAVDFTFLFIKMIAALVVACVAAVLILRYAVPKLSFAKKWQSNERIKVLSRFSLGPKQQLFLVKVEGRCILLGVTDQSICNLGDIENSGGER